MKVRPVFPNNVHGDYGTDEQCMKFKGSFAAAPLWEAAADEAWDMESKFIVYPNPSLDGQLSIIGNAEDASIQSIVVYDASGRLTTQWETSGEEQTMVALNLSSLKAGLYWISITGEGKEQRQRWVKQ